MADVESLKQSQPKVIQNTERIARIEQKVDDLARRVERERMEGKASSLRLEDKIDRVLERLVEPRER